MKKNERIAFIKELASRKGYLNSDDILLLKKKFKLSFERIRQIIKTNSILFKNRSTLIEESKLKSFYLMVDFLEKNNFKSFGVSNNYWINSKGIIYKQLHFSFKRVQWNLRENNKNDVRYTVSINAKPLAVHKLIAELFIPNPRDFKYVRAIDGNYLNVDVNNFEWVKYPAYSRVLNSINSSEESWLNFIIKNFESGLSLNILCEVLESKVKIQKLFKNNENVYQTIYTTIKKYSQIHEFEKFRFFIIRSDLNAVFINENTTKGGENNDILI